MHLDCLAWFIKLRSSSAYLYPLGFGECSGGEGPAAPERPVHEPSIQPHVGPFRVRWGVSRRQCLELLEVLEALSDGCLDGCFAFRGFCELTERL